MPPPTMSWWTHKHWRMHTRMSLHSKWGSHRDHAPSPKEKWHNRDTKLSHLHLRRTASYRLRWRSTLVQLGEKCGSFSLQVDQSPTLYKDYTRCWLHTTGRDGRGNKHGDQDNNPVMLHRWLLLFLSQVSLALWNRFTGSQRTRVWHWCQTSHQTTQSWL